MKAPLRSLMRDESGSSHGLTGDPEGGPGPSYAERVRGCLIGGALGDALGAGVEFLTLAEIREIFGPAGVREMTTAYGVLAPLTDDTQMTLFTAEGLLRASVRARDRSGCHVPTVIYRAYQRWLVTQTMSRPPDDPSGWLAAQPILYSQRAPGAACLSGLRAVTMGTLDAPANPTSKGCGAVMRSAPFGLVPGPPREAWRLAVECAVFTHGHPTGYLAAGAFAWIIRRLLDGDYLLAAVEGARLRARRQRRGGEVARALRLAITAATAARAARVPVTPERVERIGAGWIAEEALALAVYCALACPDPAEALLAAVNHSGDSDSTGAICGNLLGAAHGEQALPAKWREALEGRDLIGRLADDLVREFDRDPRPDAEPAPMPSWHGRYPGA